MTRRRVFWQLLPGYAFVVGVTLLAAVVLWERAARRIQRDELVSRLHAQALLVRSIVQAGGATRTEDQLRDAFAHFGAGPDLTFSFIGRDGRVLASSNPKFAGTEINRPEVHAAFTERRGVAIRRNPDAGDAPWAYVAVPVVGEHGPVGAIRAAAPLTLKDVPPLGGVLETLAVLLVLAAVIGVTARTASRAITKPMDRLRRAVADLRPGPIVDRLPASDLYELNRVSDALNALAADWNSKLQEALRQRNEQEAVLASMVEGVLAVDRAERIISINQAAAKLIGVTPEEAQGRPLPQILRNSALQEFVTQAFTRSTAAEREITLHQLGGTQIVKVHGARLRDSAGKSIGAVVVFNDITELRRLEQIRRDFVSNVSHELKTPITSIKGFVETLLDGAIDDPGEARHFLEIVGKQADRLNAIIEDLLMLSRLEQGEQPDQNLLELTPIVGTLQEAVDLCTPSATSRGIRIELTCDPGIQARINPTLLEQGIVNLIDNAVKYSGENSSVSVEGVESGDEVLIFVRDQGPGISADHLPRLFERFYRVDKARSRSLGGTGLGLSIVRHIVQSHHGRITVESTPGVGSSFCIHLPKPAGTPATQPV